MQQRMDAQVGKTQPRGSLPAGGDRPVDGLEDVLAEGAVVARAFDLDELAIGRKPDLAQLGEVVEALADPEVIGVIAAAICAARRRSFWPRDRRRSPAGVWARHS